MSATYLVITAHLWQSTLLAAVIGLLTLLLKRNPARTRYWVWLAALMKFLVPFGVLVSLGAHMSMPGWAPKAPLITQPAISFVMGDVSESAFAPKDGLAAPQPTNTHLPAILFGLWACGFVAIAFRWVHRWMRVRADVRTASPLPIEIGIPVVSSPVLREPGVFGIFRPVLLLPEGMAEHLGKAEWEAILAHELCHVRCYDNLTAAIYMLVETIFWFHPLVWWMGKRLVNERELACDEEVLRLGSEPKVYAEGILKICELYLESPLECVAGVTGSNLRRRIRAIMTHRGTERMNMGKKLLLATAGIVAVVGPIVVGQTAARPAFEVASVRPSKRPKEVGTTAVNPRGIDYSGASLRMILAEAYSVKWPSISSPDARIREMLDEGTYSIVAKADRPVPKEQLMLMLQTLLADRFKLTLHHDSKIEPVYRLAVAKDGPKLQASATEGDPTGQLIVDGGLDVHNMTMPVFSRRLTGLMGRIVLDQTGLGGQYDFKLKIQIPGLDQSKDALLSSSSPDVAVAKAAVGAALNDWSSSSIFTDIQKELGLKLEADKAPVDNLVIDHVEKPTEN